jgi:hypothetical protein
VSSKFRAQGPFDKRQQQLPVLTNQGVVPGPIAIGFQDVQQFAHLIELLQVRLLEDVRNHGRAFGVDHARQHFDQRGSGRLELARVNEPQSSIGGVTNPLRAVFENSSVHGAILSDHAGELKPGSIVDALDDIVSDLQARLVLPFGRWHALSIREGQMRPQLRHQRTRVAGGDLDCEP